MAANNKIEVHIAAENRQFLGKLQETMRAVKAAQRQTSGASNDIRQSLSGGFVDGASKATVALGGLYFALQGIKSLAESIVMPGFELAQNIETSHLGIAGIISSMGEINSKAIDFQSAMDMSSNIMDRLQKDAIRTAASFNDLVSAYQGVLAPGLGAGMNLKQIEEFVVVGVNSLKAMGLPSTQYVQELRDLVQGGIQPASSQLAASLGLTDADIKKAKASAEGLFSFLMKRIEGMTPMMERFPDTLAGKLSMLKESATYTSKAITDEFAEDMKDALGTVADMLGDMNSKTGEFKINPAFFEILYHAKENLQSIKKEAREMLEIFGAFDVDGKWYPSEETVRLFNRVCDTTADFVRLLIKGAPVAADILDQILKWGTTLLGIARILAGKINPDIKTAHGEFTNVKTMIDFCATALVGMFVLSKIVALVEGLAAAFGVVKVAVLEVRKAIQTATAAQAVLNILLAGPNLAQIAAVTAGIGVAVGTGLAMNEKFKNDEAEAQREKLRAQERKAFADFNKQITNNDGSSLNQDDVTSKFPKPIIDESQRELKRAIDNIANWAKSANVEIDEQVNELKRQNDQSPMNPEKFYAKLYELEQQKAINLELAAREKVGAVNKALFENETDKIRSLEKYQQETDDAAKATNRLTDSLAEITGTMQAVEDSLNAEGTTWRREVPDVDIEGLSNVAANAVSALSQKFFELTGRQMVVSSGYRDWGGHVSGDKFDIVDDESSTILEENANGIRDTIIQYAKNIGLKVLDEYANPSEQATGGHLDFDASGFTGSVQNVMGQYLVWNAGDMMSKGGAEYRKAMQALFDEGNKMLLQASQEVNDSSELETAEINNKYSILLKKFKTANMQHVVDAIKKIWSAELFKVDFSQATKGMEIAYDDAKRAQKKALESIGGDTAAALSAAETAVNNYTESVKEQKVKLEQLLKKAQGAGLKNLAKEISDALDKISENISSYFKDTLAQLDVELARRQAVIDSNPNLTSRQKEALSDDAQRQYLQAAIANKKAERSAVISDGGNAEIIRDADFKIAELENKLKSLGTTLEKVHQSGKQAFEDGLNTFLTDGITQVESLTDALNELLTTVLKAIQKEFANSITLDLMNKWYPGQEKNDDGAAGTAAVKTNFNTMVSDFGNFNMQFSQETNNFVIQLQGAFQQILQTIQSASNMIPSYIGSGGNVGNALPAHADGGLVEGAGTGTSDSILSRLSNGEFVIKAAAVKKYGTAALERINNGTFMNFRVSVPKFAKGGLVGAAGSGVGEGMANFAAMIGTEVNPNIRISNYVDGRRIFDEYGIPLIRNITQQEITKNSKLYSELLKRRK